MTLQCHDSTIQVEYSGDLEYGNSHGYRVRILGVRFCSKADTDAYYVYAIGSIEENSLM
eukprot:CAMPEP_0185753540 /NCGR_PEP_ID=MMETSP1174-20130828/12263_1 /TAXON_ID=35687 /ORGANISM="Dictyocha speculum, Strain CCMP1381" /LENGTH=58 /DNA_ID=CAMNT_0028431429 /DNA_START=380 /DNA_END=556 /DNA_ORIENTATION=-